MKREPTSIALLITLLVSLLGGLHAPPEVSAAGIPDPRFGVVEAHQAPNAATALGAGWTRVTFRWNEIQPNGPEEWNVVPISDQTLSNELARGRQVVGLLVTTPGWATDFEVGPGVPRGLHRPMDDPGNLWAQFVRAMVGRYAGRIDHWIVWNEPDIPNTQHMSWGGSKHDFVRLLQVAYTVAKETNPNAAIHMAAVTHWWDEDWFGQFLDVLMEEPGAAANNYYFDVATLHIYFQSETVYDITAHYRDMMRGHGINKPIWIVETNAAPSQDPAWPVPNAQFSVSLEQQAAYIIQAFSLAIAAGAQRVAVYKMADTETDRQANPEPFGLVRMDGSRRPAFTAYQVATTYMAGFQRGSWERRDAVSLVTIDRGDRTTTVAWARTPEGQTAMIPARTTQALLVDAQGGARQIYAERGYYYLDLPGADCSRGCQIGGSPRMLVERARASADTAPTPQAPTPPPPQPTGAGETPTAAATPTPPAGEPADVEQPPTADVTPTATAESRIPEEPSQDQGGSTAGAALAATTAPGIRREQSETEKAPKEGVTATASATPTALETMATTATVTPTPEPVSQREQTPTAAPAPAPDPRVLQGRVGDRSFILIGVLMLSLGGVALATGGPGT